MNHQLLMIETEEQQLKRIGKFSFMYAGFTDYETARRMGKPMDWKTYPATQMGRMEAIKSGYNALSVFSFSNPINDDKAENDNVIRYGDLIIDIDSKEMLKNYNGIKYEANIPKALLALRCIIEILEIEYSVNPKDLIYYASGGKGFHLYIPDRLIGSDNGDPKLHQIYKKLIFSIIDRYKKSNKEYTNKMVEKDLLSCIDFNLYQASKGHLLRLPNIQRSDKNYKIRISLEEIQSKNAEYFIDLVKDNRYWNDNKVTFYRPNKGLEKLFNLYKTFENKELSHLDELSRLTYIENNCEFIKFCKNFPNDVTETQWFYLACIFSGFGHIGTIKFHEYSARDQTRYNQTETEHKINRKLICPTCKNIQETQQNGNFNCGNCRAKSPLDLYAEKKCNSNVCDKYDIVDDHLVYYPDIQNKDKYTVVCTKIEILAKACDLYSSSWSLLVEVQDLNNNIHHCLIPFSELNGKGDDAIKKLSDLGLLLTQSKGSKSHLWNYIKNSLPEANALIVNNNGWIIRPGKPLKYVPIDLGKQDDQTEYICLNVEEKEVLYEQKGSLEDWKKHIGIPCRNNPLLQISILTALAGPLLRFFGGDGFGIHLFGHTSSGKSTALDIGRSVNGMNEREWRTTGNALESHAAMANDGTLILDEISQVKPEILYEIIYMLANGKGKARANVLGNARAIKSWKCLFLSAGEKSIEQHIDDDPKCSKYLAGQAVRAIDLPADGGTGNGIFTTLPAGVDASTFSDLLKKSCKDFKGVPFVKIIDIVKKHHDFAIKAFEALFMKFIVDFKKMNLSGPAGRVVKHFALLAGVGELAICFHILPWDEYEAIEAVKYCCRLWLEKNNNGYDRKQMITFNRIIDSLRTYVWPSSDFDKPQRIEYKNKPCIYFSKDYLIDSGVCSEKYYNAICNMLLDKKLLVENKSGAFQDYPLVNGKRVQGFLILENKFENYIANNSSDKDSCYQAPEIGSIF